MRNTYVVLIIVIMILAGCKPKSKSTMEFKTNDSSKSNNGLTMPDIGDIKNNSNPNNSNSSGSSNWSKEYRNKFLQGCISKASEKVSAAEAFSYCNCMTEKVEAKYPNEKEVDASLTSADIESMRQGCVSNSNSTQSNPSYNQQNNSNNSTQSWSVSDQREFMDNCTPGASKSMGSAAAYNYCDCMLKKLMQEYPNSADVGNVSKSHMSELASDCLRK